AALPPAQVQDAPQPAPAPSPAEAFKAARLDQLNASLSGRRRPAETAAPVNLGQELAGLTVRLIYTDDMRATAEKVQAALVEQGMQVQMFAFKKNDSYTGHIGKLYMAAGYDAAARRLAEVVRPFEAVTLFPNAVAMGSGQQFNLWIAR
ncbi:MAG: hypothetical protein KKA55_13340, partial [Proteobacteria bacterium]|nr:hypothetical protein [Pseudomonadota bacterium]